MDLKSLGAAFADYWNQTKNIQIKQFKVCYNLLHFTKRVQMSYTTCIPDVPWKNVQDLLLSALPSQADQQNREEN